MIKQLLLSILVMLCSQWSDAQINQIFLGSDSLDQIAHIIPTPDGHFIATGAKFVGNNKRVWLLKFAPDASLVWEKTFAPTKSNVDEYGNKITLLADGGMVIAGTQFVNETFSPRSGLIIRVDSLGIQKWQKEYPDVDAVFDATPNGNDLLLTGANEAGFVMLVNGSTGITQWIDTVHVFNHTTVRRIFPTDDGHFLIVGRSNVVGVGFGGVFVRKITPSGMTIWQTNHDTDWREKSNFNTINYYNQSLGATLMDDGTLWVVNPLGNDADIVMMQFSTNGELVQKKKYGMAEFREFPYALNALENGGFLISGEATMKSGSLTDYQGFAMHIDHKGTEVWRQYYGEVGVKDQLFGGVRLEDGHFLLVGASNNSLGNGNTDGWLLHADSDGNVMPWTVEGIIQFNLLNDCLPASGAPPAKDWFIEVNGQENRLLVTDEQGKFKIKLDSGIHTFTILTPEPEGAWQLCTANQTVVSGSNNPYAQLVFLVQSADGGCPHTIVGITQPDLTRCSTNTYLVTVQNLGSGNSDELILDIIVDPTLSVVSASEPYSQLGNSIMIDIDPMEGFQQKTISIHALISCNEPIGATHGMVARLMPVDCAPIWSGPRFAVEGNCNGNIVAFQLKNLGGGGATANSRFRVMADDLLIIDWTDITLPEASDSYLLDFPADGRTWRVELEQADGFPSTSHPSAAIEGCGLDKNGLYSIGFRNAWRFDDGVPEVASTFAANTTGLPNTVAEGTLGFGYYNLLGDEPWLEYSARVQNPLETAAQSAEFRFSFNPTLDLSTFQVLASNGPVALGMDNTNGLMATMKDIHVPPADFAMLRFRIKPNVGVPADAGQASLFRVDATAYFDGYGPHALIPGFNNLSKTSPLTVDPFNNYSSEILRFGGRGLDFGSCMALAPDGSVFLGGETNSYSNRTNTDGLLIKANAQGVAYWLTAIDLGDQSLNTFRGITQLDDGGCMVVGNYVPKSATDNSLSNYIPYFARIDANGHMLWHKKYWPSGPQYGAWVAGIVPTPDGHSLLYGYAQNATGMDPYYLKIDQNGDIIWQQNTAVHGSAFTPRQSVPTADGGFVFMGINESEGLNFDVFLEKIDAHGNKLWSKGYSSSKGITIGGSAIMPDGGFLVSGYSFWVDTNGSNVYSPTFVRFLPNGEAEWEKNPIIGPFNYALAYNIISDPNGGYFSVGEVYIDTVERFRDIMLLKLDENGDPVWWRNYGSKNTEWAHTALVSAPNQLLLWGFNQRRPPLNDLQALLVRVDLDGNPPVFIMPESALSLAEAFVFPNPAYDRIHVRIHNGPTSDIRWQLCNMTGTAVQSGVAGSVDFAIVLDGLPTGLYFLIFPEQGIQAKRVMVVR